MSAPNSCPSCNAQLTPGSSTGGLCLTCLLATALEPDGRDSEPQAEAATLSPGTVLGRFRIVGLLGQGGMASVYEAREAPPLDRTVALKVLTPEFLHDETFAARFTQEARVIANLEHANIVPIYASGIDNGLAWMSMRLLGGGTLSELLRGGKLPARRAARIVRDVAEALDHAHACGVIHRDIKPSNILLDPTGRAWVSDFGLARLVERPAALTQTGIVTGTPYYMAPEQALGNPLDHRCDIYSLAVVAFEMLTGSPPFSGPSPIAILMQHVNDPLPVPAREEVSAAVFQVLKKALAKNPFDRWSSAGEFVDALEASLIERGEWVPNRAVKVATGIALAASAGVMLWVAFPDRREATSEPGLRPATATTTAPPVDSGPPAPAAEKPNRESPGASRPSSTRNGGMSPDSMIDASRAAARTGSKPPPAVEAEAVSEQASPVPRGSTDHSDVAQDKVTVELVAPAAVVDPSPPPARPSGQPPPDVITPPAVVKKITPVYPNIARRMDLRGDVVLRLGIAPDGTVTAVEVLKSPHAALSNAAMRAARQSVFRPALRNGIPVASHLELRFVFQLE